MRSKSCVAGGVVAISIVFLFFLPSVSSGQFVSVNVAVSGSGSDAKTFVTDIDWDDVYADPNGRKTWNLTDDYPDGWIFELGDHNAVIENISIAVKAEPKVELGFSAVSDDGATDFLITSDVLVFDIPLINAEAYAYAEAGSLPGTVVSAVDFDSKLFRTLYNGTEIFADMVDPYTFVPGGVYDYIPSTSISGQVSSMQVVWSLNVSSGGHADGIGIFEVTGDVIPEPATILLLSLGGLALLRKR